MSAPKTKTCIIGGGGFIGQALSALLLEKGREVVIISTSDPINPDPRISHIKGDYGDKDILSQLADVDEIVLLAYSSVPRTSFDDPLADVTSNLPRVLEFLKTTSSFDLQKIVIVSTGGACYGKTKNVAVTEDHPTNPISPYGITKLAIEKYCLMYHELHGLPVVIVRPGNAYGAGQKPFTGQGFIATAIGSILEKKPMTLYGENGTVRDYTYISDIAEGLWSALEKGTVSSVYNLGSGVGTNNLDILRKLETLAISVGKEPMVTIEPARSFDVPFNVLDSTRLSNDTGWKPSISFDEGLEKTWQWFLQEYGLS